MNHLKRIISLLIASTLLFSITAFADDETKDINVFVKKLNSDDMVIELNTDNKMAKFSIPELQVGESRQITTDDGSLVNVSRDETGYKVQMGEETIELPSIGNDLTAHIKSVEELNSVKTDQVLVSGVSLDENQKQIIRDAFASAGINKKVVFSDANIMIFSDTEATPKHWHSRSDGDNSNEKHIEVRKEIIILDDKNENQ